TVFGLTSGWWRFTDRELRPHQPLLERAQWERVLTQAGFGEATSLSGLIGPSGGEGQIGLFARKAWQQPAAAAAPVETPAEKSWLIFADASGLGGQLATQLRADGAHCRIARPGKQFAAIGADTFTLRAEAPEDWTQLLTACASEGPVERIIYLWGL